MRGKYKGFFDMSKAIIHKILNKAKMANIVYF